MYDSKLSKSILFAVLSLAAATIRPVFAETMTEGRTLQNESPRGGQEKLVIIGPGGPYEAMKEAAEIFSKLKGAAVAVIKGPPETWMNKPADLIYGGAPNMLEDFMAAHPGTIEVESIRHLYKRQIGIIVRKGNPRKIATLADLGRDDIKILDVKLETMGEFQKQVPAMAAHINRSVTTGDQGIQLWQSVPELDAWITYKSWHFVLSGESEFIPLSLEGALRSTPVAIIAGTKKKKLAETFIQFLQSEKGHAIFQSRGWE